MRALLTAWLRDVLVGVRLYTRIPITGRIGAWVGHQPHRMHRAVAHLPLIGWLVGSIAGAAALAADLRWGAAVVAVTATGVSVLLTGAFHEDGLADTADALGGPADQQRALEIMSDSRLGTYGVITLALALGLKIALLDQAASSDIRDAALMLVLGHVLSRLAPLVVMVSLPYVGGLGAKAKPMADHVTRASLAVAIAWTLPAVILCILAFGPQAAALSVLAVVVVTAGVVRVLRRRLEGFTGDTLGATQQLTELGVLAVLTAGL